MQLSLHTAHGLFSADRLDDGTRLLLDHLPERDPSSVLDLGCGYGALGLPIAANGARVLCVDRDLVAVRYCARNAAALELGNAEARASLGCDAVQEHGFDLVLCNVPARIGKAGLAHLVEGGAERCAVDGEVRIVVIRDLVSDVESLAEEHGWTCSTVARGPRHSVFSIGPLAGSEAGPTVYARDEILYADLSFARPHDASDDPGHAHDGAPLLCDLLPRSPSGDALVWRSAHGVAAVLMAKRGAKVVAGDRDLIALAFCALNAERAGVTLEQRPAAWLPELATSSYSWIVAELSPTAGPSVASFELAAVRSALSKGGRALVLAPTKLTRALRGSPARPAVLGARGAWTVLGLS